MKVTHDPEADAVYIRLRPNVPYNFGDNLDNARRIDYGADQQPIGIELLGVSNGVDVDGLPRAADMARLLRAHHLTVVSSDPDLQGDAVFSGRFNVRIPQSLHRDVVRAAETDGVSLNQFVTAALARRRAQRDETGGSYGAGLDIGGALPL